MAKMPEPFGLQDFKNTRAITHLALLGVNISLTAPWFFYKRSIYIMTESGKDNKTKVDVAVIMACGMGERLAPLTYDTPKGLIKVNNERLVERQIRQLRDVGIDNIIVVVGYLKEKFEYLKEKYGVTIIYNKYFKTTNTLWTLKCIMPYIRNKNVYLSCSDIYIKKNIFNLYEKSSHFKGIYFEGKTNEWGFTLDNNDNIVAINKEGNNCYCMVGISYFEAKYTNLLCDLAEELLKDSDNDKYYWEEVLVLNIDLFKNYYLEKIDTDTIFEFDNYSEYIAFADRGDSTGSMSMEIISDVFGVSEKEIEILECEKFGITNRSYVFGIKSENSNIKYLMRVPGLETNRFIDRKIEFAAIQKLSKYNLTEKVVFFDENSGYKISEFFLDSKCIDTNDEKDLKLAMAEIKKLHNIGRGIVIEKNKDIFDLIECHTKIINENKFEYPFNDEIDLRNNVKEIINFIKSFNRPCIFCHGDPNPTNMLKTSDGVKFIDFEYTMMSDPLFEISMFALNSSFDVKGAFKLLKFYIESQYDNFVIENLTDIQLKKLIIGYFTLSYFYSYLWAINLQNFNSIDYREVLSFYHKETLEGIIEFFKI